MSFKDPCEGCLVKPVCNDMCEKVIKIYKSTVRKRTKREVEEATGYYWEDDYVDENGNIINIGGALQKLSNREIIGIKKEIKEKPKEKHQSIIEYFLGGIKLFKKGLC